MHRFHEVGGRGTLERQPIANFSNDPLFQRFNKMYACIAARYLRCFQVKRGQLSRPAECVTIRNDFGNDAPFIGSTRRERLRIQ